MRDLTGTRTFVLKGKNEANGVTPAKNGNPKNEAM
jgi:hypothetical protein